MIGVVTNLSRELTSQIHIATHSPLVLASAEAVFDDGLDAIHHLKSVDADVVLEQLRNSLIKERADSVADVQGFRT